MTVRISGLEREHLSRDALVEPDGVEPAGRDHPRKPAERLEGIRRVVQDTAADDDVEACVPEPGMAQAAS
jgi:hypothetical protein